MRLHSRKIKRRHRNRRGLPVTIGTHGVRFEPPAVRMKVAAGNTFAYILHNIKCLEETMRQMEYLTALWEQRAVHL